MREKRPQSTNRPTVQPGTFNANAVESAYYVVALLFSYLVSPLSASVLQHRVATPLHVNNDYLDPSYLSHSYAPSFLSPAPLLYSRANKLPRALPSVIS